MSWLGLGLGEFGSQLGQGREIAEEWKERRARLALEQAREKMEESLIPLRQIEAEAARQKMLLAMKGQPEFLTVPGVGVGYTMLKPGEEPGPFHMLQTMAPEYTDYRIDKEGRPTALNKNTGKVEFLPTEPGMEFYAPGAPKPKDYRTPDPDGILRYALVDWTTGKVSTWGPRVPESLANITQVDQFGNTWQWRTPTHQQPHGPVAMTPEAQKQWGAIKGGREPSPSPGLGAEELLGAAAAGAGAARVPGLPATPEAALQQAIAPPPPPQAPPTKPKTRKPTYAPGQTPTGPPPAAGPPAATLPGLPQGMRLPFQQPPAPRTWVTSVLTAPAMPGGTPLGANPDEQVGSEQTWVDPRPGIPPGARMIRPGKVEAQAMAVVRTVEQTAPILERLIPTMQQGDWAHRGTWKIQLGDWLKMKGRASMYHAGMAPPEPWDEVIQLTSLLKIVMGIPYMRGMRNMVYLSQIQEHLPDPNKDTPYFMYKKIIELIPILAQTRQDNLRPIMPNRPAPRIYAPNSPFVQQQPNMGLQLPEFPQQ